MEGFTSHLGKEKTDQASSSMPTNQDKDTIGKLSQQTENLLAVISLLQNQFEAVKRDVKGIKENVAKLGKGDDEREFSRTKNQGLPTPIPYVPKTEVCTSLVAAKQSEWKVVSPEGKVERMRGKLQPEGQASKPGSSLPQPAGFRFGSTTGFFKEGSPNSHFTFSTSVPPTFGSNSDQKEKTSNYEKTGSRGEASNPFNFTQQDSSGVNNGVKVKTKTKKVPSHGNSRSFCVHKTEDLFDELINLKNEFQEWKVTSTLIPAELSLGIRNLSSSQKEQERKIDDFRRFLNLQSQTFMDQQKMLLDEMKSLSQKQTSLSDDLRSMEEKMSVNQGWRDYEELLEGMCQQNEDICEIMTYVGKEIKELKSRVKKQFSWSWRCDTCTATNPLDKNQCSACDSPKPETILFKPGCAAAKGQTTPAAVEGSSPLVPPSYLHQMGVPITGMVGTLHNMQSLADSSQQFLFANAGALILGPPVQIGGDCEEDEEYDPHYHPIISLPENVDLRTGDEGEDVVFRAKAKLYRYHGDTKAWKEIGVGDIKILKNPETGRTRIVMRREKIHKVCANHWLTPDMKLLPMCSSDRAWVWRAVNFVEREVYHEQFAIKFKTPDLAAEFKTTFDKMKKHWREESPEVAEPVKYVKPAIPKGKPARNQPQASSVRVNSRSSYGLRQKLGWSPEEKEDDLGDVLDDTDDDSDEYQVQTQEKTGSTHQSRHTVLEQSSLEVPDSQTPKSTASAATTSASSSPVPGFSFQTTPAKKDTTSLFGIPTPPLMKSTTSTSQPLASYAASAKPVIVTTQSPFSGFSFNKTTESSPSFGCDPTFQFPKIITPVTSISSSLTLGGSCFKTARANNDIPSLLEKPGSHPVMSPTPATQFLAPNPTPTKPAMTTQAPSTGSSQSGFAGSSDNNGSTPTEEELEQQFVKGGHGVHPGESREYVDPSVSSLLSSNQFTQTGKVPSAGTLLRSGSTQSLQSPSGVSILPAVAHKPASSPKTLGMQGQRMDGSPSLAAYTAAAAQKEQQPSLMGNQPGSNLLTVPKPIVTSVSTAKPSSHLIKSPIPASQSLVSHLVSTKPTMTSQSPFAGFSFNKTPSTSSSFASSQAFQIPKSTTPATTTSASSSPFAGFSFQTTPTKKNSTPSLFGSSQPSKGSSAVQQYPQLTALLSGGPKEGDEENAESPRPGFYAPSESSEIPKKKPGQSPMGVTSTTNSQPEDKPSTTSVKGFAGLCDNGSSPTEEENLEQQFVKGGLSLQPGESREYVDPSLSSLLSSNQFTQIGKVPPAGTPLRSGSSQSLQSPTASQSLVSHLASTKPTVTSQSPFAGFSFNKTPSTSSSFASSQAFQIPKSTTPAITTSTSSSPFAGFSLQTTLAKKDSTPSLFGSSQPSKGSSAVQQYPQLTALLSGGPKEGDEGNAESPRPGFYAPSQSSEKPHRKPGQSPMGVTSTTSLQEDKPSTASHKVNNDSDDDVIFMGEYKATPEQVAKAEKLMLPPSFYLYEERPPCPGCRGCGEEDLKTKKESDKPAAAVEQETSPAFPEKSKGNDDSDDDVIFMGDCKAAPEQAAKAEKLMLPPSFYLHEERPPCPGCRGCDEEELKTKKEGDKPTAAVEQKLSFVFLEKPKVSEPSSQPSFFANAAVSSLSFASVSAEGDAGFLKKDTSNKPFQFPGTGAPVFGSSQQDNDNVAEDQECDLHYDPIISLPENVDLTTGDEGEDIVYKERAKLYRYDSDTQQWKERGVGDMKILKNLETGRTRILMRREQVLKVCANHWLTPSLELLPMSSSDRAWVWRAVDFAAGEECHEQFAIKFKTPDLAAEFKKTFDKMKEEAGPSFAKPLKSVKEKSAESDIEKPVEPAKEKPAESVKEKLTESVKETPPATKEAESGHRSHQADPVVVHPQEEEAEEEEEDIYGGEKDGYEDEEDYYDDEEDDDENDEYEDYDEEEEEDEDEDEEHPGHEYSEEPTLADKFKPSAGSWDCDTCMINNPADKSECVACSTPKPGTSKPTEGTRASSSSSQAAPGGMGMSGGTFSLGNFKFSGFSSNQSAFSAGSGFEGLKATTGTFSFGEKPFQSSNPTPSSSAGFSVPPGGFSFTQPKTETFQPTDSEGFKMPAVSFSFTAPTPPSSGSTKPAADSTTTESPLSKPGEAAPTAQTMTTPKFDFGSGMPQFSFGGTVQQKPTSGFSFVSPSGNSVPASLTASTPSSSSTSLAASVFGTTWECDACTINNTADKFKCVACLTPKPGTSQPTQGTSSSSNSQAAPGGMGMSGGTFSLGNFKFSGFSSNPSAFSAGSGFGGLKATPGTFSFGEKPSQSSNPTPSSSAGFSVPPGGFSFTQPKTETFQPTDSEGFKMPAASFSFTAPTPPSSESIKPAADSATTESLQSKPGEAAPTAQTMTTPKFDFGSGMPQFTFVGTIQQKPISGFTFSSPSGSNVPASLAAGTPSSSATTQSGSVFGPTQALPIFGATPEKGSKSAFKGLEFGTKPSEQKTEGKETISFSDLVKNQGKFSLRLDVDNVASSSPKSGSKSPVKSPALHKSGECYQEEERDDIYFEPVVTLPENYKLETGEENEEVKFSQRSKLFRFDMEGLQWKERGVGDIKVLYNPETKMHRIVMRRDQVLKVCTNHYITQHVDLQPNRGSERSWVWQAMDSSDGEPQNEQLAVRFKTEDTARLFKEVVDEAKKNLPETSDQVVKAVGIPETEKKQVRAESDETEQRDVIAEELLEDNESDISAKVKARPEEIPTGKEECKGVLEELLEATQGVTNNELDEEKEAEKDEETLIEEEEGEGKEKKKDISPTSPETARDEDAAEEETASSLSKDDSTGDEE